MSSQLEVLFARAVEMTAAELDALFAELSRNDPDLLRALQQLLHRDRQLLDHGFTARFTGPDHALSHLLELDLPPPRVEGYELLEEIGSGGMGCVYRAFRHGRGYRQEVALKVLHAGCMQASSIRRFLTEVRILAQLEHPGIARFIDAGTTTDGRPFVAMEFVSGEPIHSWCDRQRLDPTSRLRLIRQLLMAIGDAHARLIIHRDLKPGNVLITEDGRVVLLDFGIAKALTLEPDEDSQPATERYLTPRWAAPEQLAGEPVGVACDIHATGLLLYVLLCGREPFDFAGRDHGEIDHTIRNLSPPAMTSRVGAEADDAARARGFRSALELRRALRGDIELVVQRCLRKKPSERYRSIDELDADLVAVLTRQPLRMRSGERWYRFRRLVSRHRVATSLATLLLVTLLSAIAAISVQNQQLIAERDRSVNAIAVLKEAFSAANPTRLEGAAFSARQVLDAARVPLEQRHESQPALYADLAATLAEVEYSAGRYLEAAELAERASEAARRAGLERALNPRLMPLRALAAAVAGDHTQAQQLLDQLPNDERDQPQWRLVQARMLLQLGDAGEAAKILASAAGDTANATAEDVLATEIRLQLAQALRLSGDSRQALAQLDATLAWQRQTLEASHPRTLITRQHRLIPLRQEQGPAAVLEEGRQLLGQAENQFGRDSALVASIHAALAYAHSLLDQNERAAEQYRLSHQAWRSVAGDGHRNTLRIAHNLAYQLAKFGSHDDEAEQWFRDTIHRGRQVLGGQDHLVLYWTVSYSQFLRSRSRVADAVTVLVDALSTIAIDELHRATLDQLASELTAVGESEGCEADDANACALLRELNRRIAGIQAGNEPKDG